MALSLRSEYTTRFVVHPTQSACFLDTEIYLGDMSQVFVILTRRSFQTLSPPIFWCIHIWLECRIQDMG